MKPGTLAQQQAGIAARLDTRAECKVLDDVLVQGCPERKFYGSHQAGIDAWATVNERFSDQAKMMERRYPADKPSPIPNEVLKLYPTFEVTFEDRNFVLHAADLILNERHPIGRAFNRITRRTSAAKRIKNVLSATKAYAPITDPPKSRPMD